MTHAARLSAQGYFRRVCFRVSLCWYCGSIEISQFLFSSSINLNTKVGSHTVLNIMKDKQIAVVVKQFNKDKPTEAVDIVEKDVRDPKAGVYCTRYAMPAYSPCRRTAYPCISACWLEAVELIYKILGPPFGDKALYQQPLRLQYVGVGFAECSAV